MRPFAVQVFLPNYTPAQALQMHMDEEFQASAALACSANRTLESPGHVNGNAFERTAIFDSQGEVPDGAFRRLMHSATPQIQYREISRYYAPPAGTVDIQILAPEMATTCVSVHVDLQFDAAQGGGTIRTLSGQVDVQGWVPKLLRGMGEKIIASQLETRLGAGAAYAASWSAAFPNRYPDQVRESAAAA